MILAVYIAAHCDWTFLQWLSVGSINDSIEGVHTRLAAHLIHSVQLPLPIMRQQLMRRCFLWKVGRLSVKVLPGDINVGQCPLAMACSASNLQSTYRESGLTAK